MCSRLGPPTRDSGASRRWVAASPKPKPGAVRRTWARRCRVPPFVGDTRHPPCYFRKVNSALCVVPSSSCNENVAHFPAQDLSVFQT